MPQILDNDVEYIYSCVLRKFPLLGVTMSKLETVADDKIGTAATDGNKIIYSPKFFEPLSDEQKTFIFAHEVMHVAFNHILRSKDRNHRLWNIATDSVINQILKSEELPMIEGGVDMAEAINHSAEEMYEKLLKEKEKQEQKQGQEQKGSGDEQDNQEGQDGDDENEQVGHDSHDIWKDAVEQAEKEAKKQEEKASKGKSLADRIKDLLEGKKQADDDAKSPSEQHSIDEEAEGSRKQGDVDWEKSFADENKQERQEQAAQIRKKLEQRKNKEMKNAASSDGYSYGAVGDAEAVLDWKKVLKKNIDEEQDRWSYRRSGADNDYMARVEELEDEGRSETEVMLDVSGSVDVDLLKEFLRQLKPILKHSKLKVGCFDEHFYGLQEIKTNTDIDNFKITARSQWTENWDLAVKSFSKRKDVNKIVFTDGNPCPGTMPDDSTKGTNVIWLVYGNKDFHPVCGRVINVSPQQIKQKFINPTVMARDGR